MSNTFESFGLDSEFLRAIADIGFEIPTEVQIQAIPRILASDRDLIGLAQTGTGKTGAFALPCLQKLDLEINEPQILILSPTRELALQTAKEVKKFSKYKKGIKSVALYGGADLRAQSRALSKGCQVVVGTPGRTLDFIRQRRLDLSQISMVILDEADEMLKMGFQEDLEQILAETPKDKQTLLFSATMPKSIERIAKKYMTEPDKISVGARNSANENVDHAYVLVHRNDRYKALTRLVDCLPDMYGIIFCRTRVETTEIAAQLRADGYPVDVLNGEVSQSQRERVMGQFRRGHLKILVATDVAARGVDVNSLTHIINFNLPDELEIYVHRSGRTGRAGKHGDAITLVTKNENYRIRNLEKMIKTKFKQRQIPTGKEIMKSQLKKSLAKIEAVEISADLKAAFAPLVAETFEGATVEELQDKFLALLCGTMWENYQNAPDLNESLNRPDKKRRDRKRGGDRDGNDRGGQRDRKRDRGERGSRGGDRDRGGDRSEKKGRDRARDNDGSFVQVEINLGRNHGLNPHRLMGLINENYSGDKPDFGKISIGKQSTSFGIEKGAVSKVMDVMKEVSFEGQSVSISREE